MCLLSNKKIFHLFTDQMPNKKKPKYAQPLRNTWLKATASETKIIDQLHNAIYLNICVYHERIYIVKYICDTNRNVKTNQILPTQKNKYMTGSVLILLFNSLQTNEKFEKKINKRICFETREKK